VKEKGLIKPGVRSVSSVLKDEIIRRIRIGSLGPADQLKAERELCLEFGMSRISVRRAIAELIKGGYLYTIPKKGTFVARVGDRKLLRPQRKGLIGVIVIDVANQFFAKVVENINRACKKNGYDIILNSSYDNSQLERRHLESLMNQVDGFIITPTQKKIDILNFERLLRQNVPFVFIDRYIENVRKDYVIINNFSGSYKAVKYLIDKGYKHLACLAGEVISAPVRERVEGFEKGMKDFAKKREDILIETNLENGKDAYRITKKILKQAKGSTAFLVANHLLISSIALAIYDSGLKMPQDAGMIAFDDVDINNAIHLSLSIVDQPIKEMVRLGLEMLFGQIEGKSGRRIEGIILEPELKPGGAA
jgi:LacI family transcriptional regulator